MKKSAVFLTSLFSCALLSAQQKEGTVLYERTTQMQMSFQGMPAGMEQQMPRSRKDKFNLSFANNQSLWKQADPDNADEGNTFGGDGMQIRMMVAGSNDVLFHDLAAGTRVEKRELFDKTFIIDDSVRPLKWKMTGETKTILNRNCMKATAVSISSRTSMTNENGVMQRREIADTSHIIAWFASDIPVSAGPAEFQGQLPGLILEMDIADGRQRFEAIHIADKPDLASIKAPSGKKRYSPAEFRKERDKMMEDMNRNNSGGNRIFRMN